MWLTACQVDAFPPVTPASSQDSSAVEAASEVAAPATADERQNADSTTAAAGHPAAQFIASFAQPSETSGEVLLLYGQVLDVNGSPVPDTLVEIWQTDANGVYDHPQDPGTNGRDTTFQFFGMAATDADGWYAFRTIVPGRYEPRPRHIHFKVKQGGTELLTSQFYFSDDIAEVQGEGMFRTVGESGDLLLVQLVQADGQLLANGRIVVDTGIGSGRLPLTPSQATGPYYPVVDLVAYDNDLVRLP